MVRAERRPAASLPLRDRLLDRRSCHRRFRLPSPIRSLSRIFFPRSHSICDRLETPESATHRRRESRSLRRKPCGKSGGRGAGRHCRAQASRRESANMYELSRACRQPIRYQRGLPIPPRPPRCTESDGSVSRRKQAVPHRLMNRFRWSAFFRNPTPQCAVNLILLAGEVLGKRHALSDRNGSG